VLAGFQIVVGVDGMGVVAVWAFTIGFGVLLVAGLLLIILGFDALDSPLVVVVAALIPLSLSLGLVAEYIPDCATGYLIFTLVGLAVLAFTRILVPGKWATASLALVHGVSGLLIFILPFWLVAQGEAAFTFGLVGIGGGLIGIGGLMLMFLKVGRPLLTEKTIFKILPGLLLAMTAAFVIGLQSQ
jgi:hypothetical protein